MILLNTFDNMISGQLRAEEAANAKNHKPSGKLSASSLGEPLQWQVLKTLGVGTRQIDDYTLRKFEVGRDTEEWFLKRCAEGVKERQKFLEYRGAIGYADAIVETEVNTPNGVQKMAIPLEVKSTSNAKFKHILKRASADENHKLQAAFYALAYGSPYYALTYIATDDRRTHTWVFATADMEEKVTNSILDYDAQMALGVVPVFVPKLEWQAKPEYNKFPEWSGLSEKEIKMALDLYYPGAWEKYHAQRSN